MLYNNQSQYTTAVVVPNKDYLKRTLAEKGLSLGTEEGRIEALNLIEADVAMFKKGGAHETMFPDRWLPSCFAVLAEPFSEQNQMINSTMKMVRGKIEKAYADRIEYMYTPEGKQLLNPRNLEALA